MATSATSRLDHPALLPRVAAGDVGAVRQFIDAYGGLILAMARRFGHEDAEDAVQEIFIELWRNAGRFNPDLAKETTFVMLLARRRLIDRTRKNNARPPTREPTPTIVADTSPPDIAAEAALAARVIERLGPDQREVLMLTVCHGYTHQETATILGMPLGTVKAHARRGLLAVRAAIAGPDGAP